MPLRFDQIITKWETFCFHKSAYLRSFEGQKGSTPTTFSGLASAETLQNTTAVPGMHCGARESHEPWGCPEEQCPDLWKMWVCLKHHVEPIVVDCIVSHNHDHVYFYSNSIITKMNNDDNNIQYEQIT